RRIVGGAVDHRDADRAEEQDGGDERPVDVVVEAAFEHYLMCGGAPPPPPVAARSRSPRYLQHHVTWTNAFLQPPRPVAPRSSRSPRRPSILPSDRRRCGTAR